MPAPGSKLLYGNRDYIYDKKFYKELVEKTQTTLSYGECRKIVETCNKFIAEVVRDEQDGFKLPFGLGYLCSTRYIPNKPAIDWHETNKIGKHVYHANLHTFGYSVKVAWFRVGRITNTHFNEVFKFKAYKTLSQSVSKLFKGGKMYSEWLLSDFIEKSRLENLYNKKFRKELKS